MTDTNENYWDCECEENYIHPKYCRKCKFCGCVPDEQPDSMQAEVELMNGSPLFCTELAHRCVVGKLQTSMTGYTV